MHPTRWVKHLRYALEIALTISNILPYIGVKWGFWALTNELILVLNGDFENEPSETSFPGWEEVFIMHGDCNYTSLEAYGDLWPKCSSVVYMWEWVVYLSNSNLVPVISQDRDPIVIVNVTCFIGWWAKWL